MTQKKTAFDIVVQLFHDGKVEPNTGRRNWGDGPSGNILGGFPFGYPGQVTMPPHGMIGPRERDEFCVKTKLSNITPNPNFANVVNSTLMMLEKHMKDISDEMLEERKTHESNKDKSDDELRELLGIKQYFMIQNSLIYCMKIAF